MPSDPYLIASLQAAYNDAFLTLQLNTEHQQHWWNAILEAYGSSHRYFHDLNHVADIFYDIDYNINYGVKITRAEYDFLNLVSFFSYFAFDARDSMCTEKSGKYWLNFCSTTGVRDDVASLGYNMILALDGHKTFSDLCSLLLDGDLAWLSEYEERYNKALLKLRTEYAHLSDYEWAQKRKTEIQNLLARPHVYCGTNATHIEEKNARNNLKDEYLRVMEFLDKTSVSGAV